MKCQTVQKHLPLFSGGDLSHLRKFQIRNHLHGCESCRLELSKLQKTRELARQSLLQKEVHIPDDSLWEQVLYKLPKEAGRTQKLSGGKKASRFKGLVPVLVGAAAIVLLLLVGEPRQPTDSGSNPQEPMARNYPVVEHVEMPGVTVMTFQTDDPKVTIVWFFEEEPNQNKGGQNETST